MILNHKSKVYLKKLEIQGFKSFAQKTTLEFERGVSVVVGPNGSGKSNVADALRFVLGEQGMKNIRAKKSEDLIFSGSQTKSKMNIATASLFFDNKDRVFPVDFSEVVVSRKIFRDGENQYFVNNSQVRLKDLAEFIAKAKLGLKGYTIINQGMGDQILSASPAQKKEIIDDALGLKEFQIKKNNSILKLNQTKNNLEKTESLIRELTPHLKFLKRQADKLEEKSQLEKKLSEFEKKFLSGRFHLIKKQLSQSSGKKIDAEGLISSLKKELEKIEEELLLEEKKVSGFFIELESEEKKLFEIESKKSSLQREAGKLEGAIEFQKRSKKVVPLFIPVNIAHIKERLGNLKKLLAGILEAASLDSAKQKTKELEEALGVLVKDVESGSVRQESKENIEDDSSSLELEKLENKKKEFLDQLKNAEQEFLDIKDKIKNLNLSHHKEKENIFDLRSRKNDTSNRLFRSQSELAVFNKEIEELNREMELLNKEKAVLDSGENNFLIDEVANGLSSADLSDISREIERIRIRLETAELIDESIAKEYEETRVRLEFLNKEVDDLRSAMTSLRSAISKLESQIEEKFKSSFNSINKNFNKYFSILFGGGKASLELVKENKEEDSEDEGGAQVLGVEVNVSLPGKKISSISVLSGGERTLSSLALLFALVSTSPPPFLVLDEIDAPLDEANSNRFLKILDELKKNTQFIMITHNRESMRQADVLYGVTMQEDGISRLLSLKFEEADKIAA